jgi:hypothetical protein
MSDLEQQLRDLSKEKFESLIHQLLDAKYPGADIKRVDGSGGDKGIDSFRGTLTVGAAIWQDKHFRDRIRDPQKRQILDSIQTAFDEVHPALWTLCVPINLRTEEHEWFQSKVVAKYGGPEKIKLMQASDILRELIHNRPLRDAFFQDNSISNVLRVGQIAMKTEGLSAEERGELATEHAQQYLEGKKDLEPRLKAIVSIGLENTPHEIRGQGLVMSFNEGEKTTHFFARDVHDYNLDPIKFGITARPELASRLEDAIDSGVPFTVAAGQIAEFHTSSPLVKTLFEGKDPAAFQLEVHPVLPNQLATKELPLRLVAGTGSSAKEISYLPFKVTAMGRREVTMASGGQMPIEVTLKLKPLDPPHVEINIRSKIPGAEVRRLNHVLQFLDELERSGEVRVFSLETSKPLAEATGNFSSTLNHPAWLRRIVEDAAVVAEFVDKDIHIPERIVERDLENITLLKRIATGEEFSDVDISWSVTKLSTDQDRALAALNGEPLSFRVALQAGKFTIFGQEIDPGPVTFETRAAVPERPDKIRESYLATSEGEGVQFTVHCTGPSHFLTGKTAPSDNDLKKTPDAAPNR